MGKLKIQQAVILAGGAGKRLQPFTLKNPKPLVPVNGKPFLEELINLLKNNGIKEIIILTGYLGEKIKKYFGDGTQFEVSIKYSHSPFLDYFGEELKSGTRLLNAHELLADKFLLMYCDNYWPLNLNTLQSLFQQKNADILVTVFSNRDSSTKNNIFVDSEGFIKKYDPGRNASKLNGVDIGFMIVKKQVLGLLPKANSKFEDVVFPKLIRERKLLGFLTDHKYYSIGDLERVKQTAKFLKEKKVIFLDRDGVINKKAEKSDYIKRWGEFEFLNETIPALKLLSDHDYRIYIISNQAGIARGMMSFRDLEDIHRRMVQELKKNRIKISGIYFCPHGWDEGCSCRKPKPGMFYKAADENMIDLTKTIFIGDDIRDKHAGEAAGIKTVLVSKKNNLLKIVKSIIK